MRKHLFLVSFYSNGDRLCILGALSSSESMSFMSRASFWYSRFSTPFSAKSCISSSSSFLFISNSIFFDQSGIKNPPTQQVSAFFDFRLEVFEPLSWSSLPFPTERRFCATGCDLSASVSPSLFCRPELLC